MIFSLKPLPRRRGRLFCLTAERFATSGFNPVSPDDSSSVERPREGFPLDSRGRVLPLRISDILR